jgi:hypothetical protein
LNLAAFSQRRNWRDGGVVRLSPVLSSAVAPAKSPAGFARPGRKVAVAKEKIEAQTLIGLDRPRRCGGRPRLHEINNN